MIKDPTSPLAKTVMSAASQITETEPQACHITRLRLFQFRNYTDQVIEFGQGINVITGANAQGKTNILEAVATVALTRSPRTDRNSELIGWPFKECRVDVAVNRPQGPYQLEVHLRRLEHPARSTVTSTTQIDGKSRTARAVLGICPVVMFWPEDLQLVKSGPALRRKFLDTVLSQLSPPTAADLVRYRRLLEQRNALLRQIRAELASVSTLASFTIPLTECGGRIRVARRRLLQELEPFAQRWLLALSGSEREELSLTYLGDGLSHHTPSNDQLAITSLVSNKLVTSDSSEAGTALAAELEARQGEELARGSTVAGPHRDDIEIFLNGRPARTSASQGQQRSLVLACKLAEINYVAQTARVNPVLILDDVLSELDAERRAVLMEALATKRDLQVLLSTAEPHFAAPASLGPVHSFTVQGGRVHAHSIPEEA